jgi:DNA-binding Lrp family transcriptional regulator
MPYQSIPAADLDNIDRSLIGLLIRDGRATYTSLAPIVGLSHTAVRARVQRLLDDEIVTVTARIDPRSLGAGVFGFGLVGVADPARDVSARFDDTDEVVFAACLTGKWALMLELRCRDNDHLLETLDRVRSTTGVEELESLTVLDYFKQGWTGIAAEVFGLEVDEGQANPTPAPRPLDEVDRRLVRELVIDGRASYADLADAIGLSQTAIRARVQRLLDEGIVVIQAYANAAALGVASFSTLLISASGEVRDIVSRLCPMPEITLIAATGGRFDIVCEVWCRDNRHLLQTLDEIRAMPGVGTVESGTFLEVVKQEYRISGADAG